MFERFTDRARKAVVIAQEEARALESDHIGTEHLLLALVQDEESTSCRVLTNLGATPDAIRKAVIGPAEPPTDVGARAIPFSPQAKKALEQALREALRLGHHSIGTGHILLGLLREEGKAARILAELNIDRDSVRTKVRNFAAQAAPGPRSISSDPATFIDRLNAIEARLVAVDERLVAIQTRLNERSG